MLGPINTSSPVNFNHPLNRRGLISWHLPIPNFQGGQFLDLAKNSNFSLTGMTSPNGWAASTKGWAIRFNGSTSYLLASNSNKYAFERTDPFTLMAWINATSFASYPRLWSKVKDANPYLGYEAYITPSGYMIVVVANNVFSNAIAITTTSLALTTGAWHFVAVTYDGSVTSAGINAYINGRVAQNSPSPSTLTGTTVDNASFQFGGRNGNPSYSGLVAEVRVHSQCLSPHEIWRYYAESLAGYPTMLNRLGSRLYSPRPGGPFPWYLDNSAMSGGLQTMGL